MSVAGFYRAFEDRHRGSRELILERLQVYLPFIRPLLQQPLTAPALDLGCGRGEWLELLGQQGFQAHGVDLDAGMLEACQALGMPVSQGNALSHLAAQDADSLSVVSGFHIAEHLAFEDLENLVVQAMRVLQPGGLLILETPNPENLVVGSSNFYLDPTHQRPLPPLLLAFLVQHHGFARVCTLRLQESPGLRTRSDIGLMDVLGGASPDYAIVAQKQAAPEVLAGFDAAFNASYGLQTHELAQRYDSKLADLQQRFSAAQVQLDSMAALTARFEKKMQWAEGLKAENEALKRSGSWRLTAPLRGLVSALIGLKQLVVRTVSVLLHQTIDKGQKPVTWLMAQVLRHPRLSQLVNSGLMRFAPGVHARLLAVGRNHDLVAESELEQEPAPSWADLTPRARQIYADLNVATQQRPQAEGAPHANRH